MAGRLLAPLFLLFLLPAPSPAHASQRAEAGLSRCPGLEETLLLFVAALRPACRALTEGLIQFMAESFSDFNAMNLFLYYLCDEQEDVEALKSAHKLWKIVHFK
ncbi:hypothetical protein ABZP36_006600 [Zizania latifolia]